jgi:predicted RNA methylase
MNTFFKIYDDYLKINKSLNLNYDLKNSNNKLLEKIKLFESKIYDNYIFFLKNMSSLFLFSPFEYLYPKNILDIIKSILIKSYYQVKQTKILTISLKDNNFYYNEILFVPLIKLDVNYDWKIIFYELFYNNKYLIGSSKNNNYLSIQIYGSQNITDKTLLLRNDIFEVIDFFTKEIFYKKKNNYDIIYNPIKYGEILDYNEVKFVDNTKVNFIFEHMFNKKVFDNLINNKKKYILIETRTKVDLISSSEFYNSAYETFLLYEIFIIINKLEIDGNLILESRLFFNENTIKLLYLLKKTFQFLKIFYSSLNHKYFFIFINFNGNNDINMKEFEKNIKLIQDKFKKDNNFYKKEIINYDIDKLFKIDEEKYNDLLNDIYNIYDFKYKIENLFYNIVKLGLKEYKSLKKNEKDFFVRKIMEKNLELSMEYIKKYNWEINPYYLTEGREDKRVDSSKFKKFIEITFPEKLKIDNKIITIDLNKIQISSESIYSVTPFSESEKTVFLMAKFLKKNVNEFKNMVITDGTTNVGGNMIAFCKYFKFVNGVEIEDIHVDYLKNNLELYGFKNYKVINGDYTKEYDKLEQDAVFLDPPWGGVLYKYYDRIGLYLSGIEVSEIIQKLKTKYVILKAPKNYDTVNLQLNVDFNYAIIYKLRRYLLIMIEK